MDHPDVGAVVGEVHRLLITDLAGEVAPEIPLAGWLAVQGDGALEVDLTQQEGEHLCVLLGWPSVVGAPASPAPCRHPCSWPPGW